MQLGTIDVLKSLTTLKESPDFELCQISEKKPGVLDELAAERKKLLEKESAELEKQASQLAEEIEELTGEEPTRIGFRPTALQCNCPSDTISILALPGLGCMFHTPDAGSGDPAYKDRTAML